MHHGTEGCEKWLEGEGRLSKIKTTEAAAVTVNGFHMGHNFKEYVPLMLIVYIKI